LRVCTKKTVINERTHNGPSRDRGNAKPTATATVIVKGRWIRTAGGNSCVYASQGNACAKATSWKFVVRVDRAEQSYIYSKHFGIAKKIDEFSTRSEFE